MRTQSVDTSPEAERVLIELIRKAPIAKRFELVRSLTTFAIRLNKQNISEHHPNATKQQVAEMFVLDHYDRVLADGLHSALQEKHIHLSNTPNIIDAITPITTLFEQMNVPYCLTGTLANSIYGMQRAAFDIDFIADLHPRSVLLFLQGLAEGYYFDQEIAKEAVQQKASFNGLHLESMLRVNMHMHMPPFDSFVAEVYQRARCYSLTKDSRTFRITSPEDIVLIQLIEYQAGGEVADDCWNEILGVLKIQKETIALAYMKQWATALGADTLLKRAFEDAGMNE